MSSLGARADEEAPAFSKEPLFTWAVQDATLTKELVQKNRWWSDFERSTVFRGLMHRAGPVLNSLARPDDAWQGRLLDYAFDKIMKGRPLEVDYYSRRKMNPLAFRVLQVSDAERAVAATLIKVFRNGDNAKMKVASGSRTETVEVIPLRFYTEKFAAVLTERCFTFARDPWLAARSSLACGQPIALSSDAALMVNLRDLFPTFQGVLERFYTTGPSLRIDFSWKKGENRFVAQAARVPVQDGSRFVTGRLSATFFKAIPSSSHLAVTQFIPEPKAWTLEGLGEVLKKPKAEWKGLPTVPVTLVLFGMDYDKEQEKEGVRLWKPQSALLIPVVSKNSEALSGLSELFSETNYDEVGFRKVCGPFVAFSPEPEALNKIEQACKGKTPSFAQLSPDLLKPAQGSDSSTVLYANAGGFFSSMLEIGLKEEKYGENETRAARRLLSDLPTYLFAGRAEKQEVILKGVSR